MSKQDIEKRLGFAAQGVKAEMAIGSYKQGDRTVTVNGKKYEVLPYQMDFFIKELATLDTPEWRADVVKEYLRRGYIKSTASRPGAKAKMGFLSRVGYAATALTADPADPKSAEYRKQVSEAKAAAKDAITNYKFMRDKVKERLAALDAYVTNAIKVINSATSAKDIEHYVEQLRIAVKSQSMILGASKSPFSRAGVKVAFAATPAELKSWAQVLKKSIQASKKAEQQSAANSDEKYDYGVWKHGTMRLLSAVESDNRSQAKKELNDLQRSGFDVTNTQDIPVALRAWVSTTTASRPGVKTKFAATPADLEKWLKHVNRNVAYAKGIVQANKQSGEVDADDISEFKNFSLLSRAIENKNKSEAKQAIQKLKSLVGESMLDQLIHNGLIEWANSTTASRPGVKAKA